MVQFSKEVIEMKIELTKDEVKNLQKVKLAEHTLNITKKLAENL